MIMWCLCLLQTCVEWRESLFSYSSLGCSVPGLLESACERGVNPAGAREALGCYPREMPHPLLASCGRAWRYIFVLKGCRRNVQGLVLCFQIWQVRLGAASWFLPRGARVPSGPGTALPHSELGGQGRAEVFQLLSLPPLQLPPSSLCRLGESSRCQIPAPGLGGSA